MTALGSACHVKLRLVSRELLVIWYLVRAYPFTATDFLHEQTHRVLFFNKMLRIVCDLATNQVVLLLTLC